MGKYDKLVKTVDGGDRIHEWRVTQFKAECFC